MSMYYIFREIFCCPEKVHWAENMCYLSLYSFVQNTSLNIYKITNKMDPEKQCMSSCKPSSVVKF